MDPAKSLLNAAVNDVSVNKRPKPSGGQAVIPPYIGDPEKAVKQPLPAPPPQLPAFQASEGLPARVDMTALPEFTETGVLSQDSSLLPRPQCSFTVGERVVFKPTLSVSTSATTEYAGGRDAYIRRLPEGGDPDLVVTLQSECSFSVPIRANAKDVVSASQHRLYSNGMDRRYSIYGPMISRVVGESLYYGVRMSITNDSPKDTTLSTVLVRDIWIGDTVVIDTKIRNEMKALPFLVAGFVAYNPMTRTTRWQKLGIYDRAVPNQWKVCKFL